MDNCKHEMAKHVITRGNLDGIVSASVFLNRFPASKVTFVTSPTAASKVLAADNGSRLICVVDLAVVPELAQSILERRRGTIIRVVDHHQPPAATEGLEDVCIIDLERSAAGCLHRQLGSDPAMDRLVSLADRYELSNTDLLQETLSIYGAETLEKESTVLDFAWRLNVEDDDFRLRAAYALSNGTWPSQVPFIMERYQRVLVQKSWARALESVRRNMEKKGKVGILDFKGRRKSLHGFGSKALLEVAKEKGCQYAVMISRGEDCSTVSLRALRPDALNLGRFVEEFIRRNGYGGGGHPASAGARIPTGVAPNLIQQLDRATC